MRSPRLLSTSSLIVLAASCVLTGCGEKSTTTQIQPDGSTTTTVTDKKLWGTTSSTTTTPPPPGENVTDPDHPQINVNLDQDTADGADRVHVRGPGVKIDADGNSDKVDINVPFVKVHRDASGKVNVRTPFVNIQGNDGGNDR